ncbi:MAG: ATP-binding protein [Candidatus Bathyarchaeia archaeon]
MIILEVRKGLFWKNIDQVSEEDLKALIDNSVIEGKTLEYKQSLPGNSDSEKREFLADVSSFANASGGDLIYGIQEREGIPVSLEGLDIENIDEERRRLEDMIRNGIDPRIPSMNIKPIKLSNGKIAIIIRVHKSWFSPHRVIFKGHDKFYSRNTSGKYPMDVTELRNAFILSETRIEKIKNFKGNRISNIIANETPIPLCENGKIILHLIPLISSEPSKHYDIHKIYSDPSKMKPIDCSAPGRRYNLDGVLTFCKREDGTSYSYVQFFRNGILEAVNSSLLHPLGLEKFIPSVALERQLIKSLDEYLSLLKTLEVEPPILLFLTLTGVKGYSMPVTPRSYWYTEVQPIDRDTLSVPEVVIEGYDVVAKDVLRPCFDCIWNACGLPRSLNYDENGEWVGEK